MTELSRMDELKLDDVGTRREHLMDLQELWVDALSIVIDKLRIQQYQNYQSHEDVERKEKLEVAIDMLEHFLTKDYVDLEYGRQIDSINKET